MKQHSKLSRYLDVYEYAEFEKTKAHNIWTNRNAPINLTKQIKEAMIQ
jgi:hypothetical protein